MTKTSAAKHDDRLRASRDLIRRTASLLSAAMPLQDALRQFAALLAVFVDASFVAVAIGDEREARIEYAFEEGRGGQPDDPTVHATSTTSHVLRTGEPLLCRHRKDWPGATEPIVLEGRKTARYVSALFVPIAFGGSVAGVLSVQCRKPEAYDADDLMLLESCAVYLGARIHDEAQQADRRRLERMAFSDALTGLANRRSFDETLAREWQRCGRSGSPLSVLLLDVDFFKQFNDTYGHVAGDACLKQIGRALEGCVRRPGDLAARYGGEEFALILPETDAADAVQVGESVAAAVRALEIAHQGSSLGYATASVGCATAIPDASAAPPALTAAADEQLYRAKEHGRNRVASESYLSNAPVAQRRATVLHKLPSIRSAFFGREVELAAMEEALGEHRLLTLAGPGGVGKTRLAVEFGHRSLERYPDGVWFVDLASLSDPSFVAQAMLAALGLREEVERDAEETVVRHLSQKTALLIVDNCEHVIAEATRVVDRLLDESAHLAVIATSREVLAIPGELVYRVPPFGEAEGAELFLSRAHAAAPGLALTAQDVDAVKRICKRLDGIALAIELAAARVRTITLDELWKRLDNRFTVLTGGKRTELPRHQRLHSLIDWSYNLLGASEKLMLNRLSIFAGAFTLELATSVCATEPLAEQDVLDLLAQLIDKSLVQFEPVEGRYVLLESTKAFGLERLRDSGEIAALERRRAERMRELAGAALDRFRKGGGERLREEVASDYAEYRAALQWALAEEHEVALGAALAAALGWFWQTGQWREGRYWHERALAHQPSEIGLPTWAIANLGLANMLHAQGEYALMAPPARRALEGYGRLGDVRGEALARNALAIAAKHAGRFEEARESYEANANAFRELGDRRLEAITLQNLAELLTDCDREYAASEELYARAVRIHRERDDAWMAGAALGGWSLTAAYQGALDRADTLAREALEIFRRMGDEMRGTEALICLGHFRVWAGNPQAASEALREALERLKRSMNDPHLARFAEASAELALSQRRPLAAAEWLGFSEELRLHKHLAKPAAMGARLESAIASLRAALGDAEFSRAWERGREFSVQAVLAAIEELFDGAAR